MADLVQIERMNGKPVYYVPAKSVLNLESGFGHKLLCDFLTFSAGSACAYECSYCYVTDLMKKSPHLKDVRDQHLAQFPDQPVPSHSEIVIRRRGVLDALRHQLTVRERPRFDDPSDQRVIYMSPLVDVAANPTLCEETVEVCRIILELTHWHIRMLSKSSFLPRIAKALGRTNGARKRIIYGVSTGTLDDDLARCFEEGTALVSKRLESLRWLQDNGYRTFGMICPSLPLQSSWAYEQFSRDICEAIRIDRCEHVWAEVMNLRGESFTRTIADLKKARYHKEAYLLEVVTEEKDKWELYARDTFLAHIKFVPAKKFRFLQYVTATTRSWWEQQQSKGAVLL